MKLKDGFLNRKLENDNYLIPDSQIVKNFRGVVRNNETAAFIIDCLREQTTEENIIDAMCEKYDASYEKISEGVRFVLDGLRSIDALEE